MPIVLNPYKQKLSGVLSPRVLWIGDWKSWKLLQTAASIHTYPWKTKVHTQLYFCHNCSKYSLISSVQFSHSFVSDFLQHHESQHARPPCPSPTPGVHSNSRPLSRWCHPPISSSVIPFSSCLQSFPASGNESVLHIRWPKYWSFSFSIGLLINIQGWFL